MGRHVLELNRIQTDRFAQMRKGALQFVVKNRQDKPHRIAEEEVFRSRIPRSDQTETRKKEMIIKSL